MSDGIACLLHQIRRRDAAAGGIIAHDVNDLLIWLCSVAGVLAAGIGYCLYCGW